MSPLASSHAARRVVRRCFGSALAQQERGFYVCLELLAILRGHHLAGMDLLADGDHLPPFIRTSHDFARRLAVGDLHPTDDGYDALDADAVEPLQALLESVTVKVPGVRRRPEWFGTHLYPYVGELIHYDAVRRRGKPALERYLFRGAGGLAHEMLRSDPDHDRLAVVRSGLLALVSDSGSALGRVAAALHQHDFACDEVPWNGDVEEGIDTHEAMSKWPELLRRGVMNIVGRHNSSVPQRVEHLMHWVPYCVARHALHLAQAKAGEEGRTMTVDLRARPNPLRSASRQDLESVRWTIVAALQNEARSFREELEPGHADRPAYDAVLEVRERLVKGPRAFVTETLAAVGALNATTGRRWFTLRLPLLETFVFALIPEGEELEFERFLSDRLFGDLDLVIDGKTAARCGLVMHIDLAEFDANAEFAARALRQLGLLTEYSDSTRMVGTRSSM